MSSPVFSDFSTMVSLWRHWLYSAFVRVQIIHRQSMFSYLWEPLTLLIVSSILAVVWSKVLGVPDMPGYFLYLITGLSTWILISDLVRRTTESLLKNSSNMTGRVLPLSMYISEDVFFNFIRYLLSLPVVVVLCFILGDISLSGLACVLLGLLLILIAAYGMGMTIGVAAFYFPDIKQLVFALMRLGFLITPIIWKPDRLGEYAEYVIFNPFYSYIDIVRRGLLGQSVDFSALIVASCLSMTLFITGLFVLNGKVKSMRRTAFFK